MSSMCRILESILHPTPWRSLPAHTACSPPFSLSQAPSVTQQESSARSSSWLLTCPRITLAGLNCECQLSMLPITDLKRFSPQTMSCQGSRVLAFLKTTDHNIRSALHSSHPEENWISPCGKDLHHRNWQTLHTRVLFFFPKEFFPNVPLHA